MANGSQHIENTFLRAGWRRRVASDNKTRILMASRTHSHHTSNKFRLCYHEESRCAKRNLQRTKKNIPPVYSFFCVDFVMLKYCKKLPFCDSSCLYNPTRLIEVMLGLMMLAERNANLELYINSVGIVVVFYVSIHLIFSLTLVRSSVKRRWDKWSAGSHSSCKWAFCSIWTSDIK